MKKSDSEGTTAKGRLAVFTRSLDSANLKSRLSAEIGTDKAHRCYHELLTNTLQCATNFDTTVYVEGPIIDETWLLGLPIKPQSKGDLGQRMLACFEDGVCVVVGGDSPLMSVAYLSSAFNALESHDVVFGPTEDGGYVLIGMNRPQPLLFENIPWSTPNVLSETVDIASSLDLRVKCLALVWDIDTKADYDRWLELKKEHS